MAIYVLADLHLSLGNEDKPMDVFGKNWHNYTERIKENWLKTVKENDLIVLPGDFCWAMYLEDSVEDFKFINELPGKKILLKGNHDYWWETLTKMRNFIKDKEFENIDFLINNAYEFEDTIIVGTRGWSFEQDEESKRILNREACRLENSIMYAKEKFGEEKEMICMLHYPPLTKDLVDNKQDSIFTEILMKYNIKKCYYGHLHAESHKNAIEGIIDGIEYKLISSDYLEFMPYLVKE